MTDTRPIVLTIAGHYLPGYRAGGPIRSLANLVAALGDEVRFRIVAYDRDHGSTTPYGGLTDGWAPVGAAEVRYLTPDAGALRQLWRLLRHERYDTLYLQTFFDWRLALVPLLLRRLGLLPPRRTIIAPRGQFATSALALGAGRKRLYTAVAKLLLRGDETWQATAPYEVDDIKTRIPRAHIVLAPNVAATATAAPPRAPKRAGILRAVFISRVVPVKNLLSAIRYFDGVRGEYSLDVYGPIENAKYWAECQVAAQRLSGGPLTLTHRGSLSPDAVAATFAQHDLFLFPTSGENFGHVIFEALLAGCTCLISDRTPWRGLEAAGAGWDLPLDAPASFRAALQWSVDADDAALQRLSAGARALALRYLASDESVAASRAMLSPSSAA